MFDFFRSLLDTSGFVPRWECGNWSSELGWLLVGSDLLIWLAYMIIPAILLLFVRRRRDLPFHWMFVMFGVFILGCGLTHLIEACLFWTPVYRLSAAVKLLTAAASWITVLGLIPIVPRALALRSAEELEREIERRQRLEDELEQRVRERMAELARVNTSVQAEVEERRRVEEALRQAVRHKDETLRLLDSLLANAPVGFAFFDPQHCYYRLNHFLADINGLPVTAHLGRPIREVLPVNAAVVDPVLDQVFATAQAVRNLEIEGETPAAPGVRRHWLTGFYPVVGADGATALVGAVVMEITAQKRAEQALRESDRRKDEFLAMLAHELRNPLAPVRNALEILKMRGADSTVVEQAHAMMERQVQQLVRLVDDLLDVSRINRGKIQLRKERVELSVVVARAVETARPVIDAQGHELIISLPPHPICLEADLTRLAQVLANLLNNAAKYTDRAGKIRLTAAVEGVSEGMPEPGGQAPDPAPPAPPSLVIRVSDTGIGMIPEVLTRIFEPFTQADRSLARSQGGLGIGLTLVARLVELHDGHVTAHSDGPGLGSEFAVHLPLPPQLPVPVTEKPMRRTAEAVTSCRVLVVDDNVDAAETLGLMLRLWGHDIRLAHNGPAALEAAATYHPELVLLDIGLPGMSGHDVARQLRRQPETQGIMLVAVTGYGQEEDRRRSREAGFDHHLTKPVDTAALEGLLAEVAQAEK